jgi:hypothetical protein
MKNFTLFKFALWAVGFFILTSISIGQTTINFDETSNWTAGSAAIGSYAIDHVYADGLFSATGGPALRNSTALQDGFPGAFGTYSWRLQNVTTVDWRITIASGGVSAFSMDVRRWDGSPSPDFNLEYSIDGGVNWTFVALINNTSLNNSSDWTNFNGVINSSNTNILIRLVANGTTERIMIDNFIWTGYSGGTPLVATPTFNPPAGIYYSPQNVAIETETPGATIYYTTDGTDPDEFSSEYVNPIPVSVTTTIKARAYAAGFDPSAIATALYNFPVDVADIVTLRAGATDGTVYRLTGEAILTAKDAFNNRKFIEDATAAIMIFDNGGIITTDYNIGDGIKNITGTLSLVNQMLRFIPTQDPGAAFSMGNPVSPATFSIDLLTSGDQAKLVKLENVTFTAPGTFANGQNYTITDGINNLVFRTDFWDVDYIGSAIPELPVNITGVIIQYNTDLQIVARNSDDFEQLYDIGWANLQWPPNGTITLFQNFDVYAQIWVNGITDQPGQGQAIQAWIGYSPDNTDPATWTNWVPATYNSDAGNNDEYFANIGADIAYVGTYYYASRFQLDNGDFVYGGYNGGFWDGITNVSGELTVNEPSQFINWANLQWPPNGEITSGADFTVYAQVYAAGITPEPGPVYVITAWIGYNSADTDPATWTNWINADYNAAVGNNDEYMANIGTVITQAGTYYYASRFQLNETPYVYGGYSGTGGGFWDGVVNVSGVLQVNAPPPPNVWLNEIHYDNDGPDVNEFVEVVLENAANYDLSEIAVLLINGNDGLAYNTKTLDLFTEGLTYGDFTYYYYVYPANGIQNGAPDGVAITFQGSLIDGQFLSYEGSFTGVGSPVDGILSIDIGVAEVGTTPIGYSLQLGGVGTQYSDFIWFAPDEDTPGIINNQQSFFPNTTWNGSVNSDWNNADNWDNGIPKYGMSVFIPDVTTDPELSASAWIGNLTIDNGANLTITAGGALTVNGVLTNNSGMSGLVIKSDATGTGSLIESSGVSATVERYFTGNDVDWHLVSSPVTGATADVFIGMYLQDFDPITYTYTDIVDPATLLNVMQGYALYSTLGASNTVSFDGNLNAGNQSASFVTGFDVYNWNLFGNPYPSSIDWELVTIPAGMSNEVHYIDAATGADLSYVQGVGGAGSQYIPPMQGFFVSATTGGTFTVGNDQRTHMGSNLFYKNANPDLVVLEASNGSFSDEAWIHFNQMAEVEHDGKYDAYKRVSQSNPSLPQIFSYTPAGVKLSVNGLPEVQSVPVGFTALLSGEFSISAKEAGGFSELYLEDLFNGSVTNLLTGSCSFFYNEGDLENRFMLHFAPLSVSSSIEKNVNIWSYGNEVTVMVPELTNGIIRIYNMMGQEVVSTTVTSSRNTITVPQNGNYVVTLVSDQTVVAEKVIIR